VVLTKLTKLKQNRNKMACNKDKIQHLKIATRIFIPRFFGQLID